MKVSSMAWYAFGTKGIYISYPNDICAAFKDFISHILLTFMFCFYECKIDRITFISI